MKHTFLFLACIFAFHNLNAQKFGAAAVLGMTASQIDGDGYAGYSKVGLSLGARLSYPLSEKSTLSMEFLYSQRGSRTNLWKPKSDFGIDLNYAEIPLIFSFHDWFIENDNYYKVGLDAGISYARLINSSTKSPDFDDFIAEGNPNDLSYVLGLKYRFTKKIGMNFRYTRSLAKMYKDDNLDYGGLLSYFLTFRVEYFL